MLIRQIDLQKILNGWWACDDEVSAEMRMVGMELSRSNLLRKPKIQRRAPNPFKWRQLPFNKSR